jgi:hypothetical protein
MNCQNLKGVATKGSDIGRPLPWRGTARNGHAWFKCPRDQKGNAAKLSQSFLCLDFAPIGAKWGIRYRGLPARRGCARVRRSGARAERLSTERLVFAPLWTEWHRPQFGQFILATSFRADRREMEYQESRVAVTAEVCQSSGTWAERLSTGRLVLGSPLWTEWHRPNPVRHEIC